MQWLKQSTVVVINFGPFLDKTDGVTLEDGAGIITSIDHATTGIKLSKNGGTLAVREQGANFVASVYDAHGFYKVSLSAIDTGTLGRLLVVHSEPATYLSVWAEFMVIPAQVWDSFFGADKLDVAVVEQANIDFGALQKASIGDAIWDEVLSGHAVSGSAGVKLTAAGAGSGTITWTYTLTDSVGGTPIADAHIWVTTDLAGSNIIASGTTNASGQVIFYLDAGNYYIWRAKAGWDFVNPDGPEVVS